MSTKAIREVLERSKRMWRDSDSVREIQAALAEVEAIERAAKDLTRMSLGDGVYRVRDSHEVLSTTPNGTSTWEHPDVVAWGKASNLLAFIAEQD